MSTIGACDYLHHEGDYVCECGIHPNCGHLFNPIMILSVKSMTKM